MYESYYEKLQLYFGENDITNHYTDRDAFVLSIISKDLIKDLKSLEDLFDFSNLNENLELFRIKNKKLIGKFKIQTPKINKTYESFCLRSEMYAFKCRDVSKNKLKGICESQSRNIKFEEHKICLNGCDYKKDCNIYIIRSSNHDMYLQRVLKSTLSPFDDKRSYKSIIEIKPWN